MKCRECATLNPDGAKFCIQCGSSMSRRCTSCSSELPPTSRFCPNCGARVVSAAPPPPEAAGLERYIPKELLHKLVAARSQGGMRGERRTVTMLFSDVQGSTATASKLDPEDWAEIMKGAFERMVAPVFRYEGTLARLMGDAILAFFGAPIGHEDDPERAVLAGLAILDEIGPHREAVRRRWGIDFDLRVGINTGLVVVGEMGSDLRLEYTAMGDAVNLAARMEQTAGRATVQISESTHRLVAPMFEVEALGSVEVKGKDEPVPVWRVARRKLVPGSLRGIEGLRSPLVGRAQELGGLRSQIEAVRRGSGQIISVIGEAGLGKSRLVAELRDALGRDAVAGAGAEIEWREGRSLSYEVGTPYAPWARILREWTGVDGTESDTDARQRVRTFIGNVAPARVDALAAYIMTILQIPLDGEDLERVRHLSPPELKAHVTEAMLEIVERRAMHQPLVLVLEDLHWVDSASLELALAVQSLTERAMLGVVALFRPRHDEASWRFHEQAVRSHGHRYLALQLEPLADADARSLVANLLHVEGLPESMRLLILDKAEGNPFFVEEVIRSLIDTGAIVRDGEDWKATREIGAVAIPDTLQGVLTARLDALDESSRQIVQTASVIGREFELEILASIVEPLPKVEEALLELQRRGIVREKARLPRRLYGFKHVLSHDAAYGSLLLKTRRELHAAIAEVLVKLQPERADAIARHFLEARERVRALPWLVTAAERASRVYALTEAATAFEEAVRIVEESPDVALGRRAYEGLGTVRQLSMDVEGALAVWRAMEAFALKVNEPTLHVSALNKLGMVLALFVGDEHDATKVLDQAKQIAEGADCTAGIVEGGMVRCFLYTTKGELDTAYRYLDEADQLSRALDAEEPRLFAMVHVANTLVYLTEFERAWERLQDALAYAREKGNKHWESELLGFSVPTCLLAEGKVEEAWEAARRAETLAAEAGLATPGAMAAITEGQIARMVGRMEDAIACNERAVHLSRLQPYPHIQSMALCTQGTTFLQVHEQLRSRAVAQHAEATRLMGNFMGEASAAVVCAEAGFCALELGAIEEADAQFDRGLTTGSAPKLLMRPVLLSGKALVALRRGQPDDADRFASEALESARSRRMRHLTPMLGMVAGIVARDRGALAQARALFAEAASEADTLGFLPLVWQVASEAAQLEDRIGPAEEAQAWRDRGHAALARIASGFKDSGLRDLYVEQASRRLGVR